MLDKITTLEEAKSQITKDTKGTIHLGSLNIGETHDPSYEIMKWAFEEILPPLKIFNFLNVVLKAAIIWSNIEVLALQDLKCNNLSSNKWEVV